MDIYGQNQKKSTVSKIINIFLYIIGFFFFVTGTVWFLEGDTFPAICSL